MDRESVVGAGCTAAPGKYRNVMLVTKTPAARPLPRPVAVAQAPAPTAPAAPKGVAPQVKAPAQGALKTTARVFSAIAGGVGMGGLGGFAGGAVWFLANAGGRALSSNVIGIGVLAGLALGGLIGWKSGGFWGGAIEETLK